MRNPTPVTTRIITEESGSSCRAAGAVNPPAWIQGKRTWTKRRSFGDLAASAITDRSETTKATPTTRAPRSGAGALGKQRVRAVQDPSQKGRRRDEPQDIEDSAHHFSTLS